jgi:hypothetical protein
VPGKCNYVTRVRACTSERLHGTVPYLEIPPHLRCHCNRPIPSASRFFLQSVLFHLFSSFLTSDFRHSTFDIPDPFTLDSLLPSHLHTTGFRSTS